MNFSWTLSAVPSLAAACMTAAMGLHLWRLRSTPVGGPFLVAISATSLWMICDALIMLSVELEQKIAFFEFAHIGIAVLAPGFSVMALRSRDLGQWTKPHHIAALSAIPTLWVILLYTNNFHGWMYSEAILDPSISPHGLELKLQWPYAAATLYQLSIFVATMLFTLQRQIREWSLYKVDLVVGIVGAGGAVACSAVDIFWPELFPAIKLAPLGVVFMTGVLAWGIPRTGLHDVVRVGRHRVIDCMTDGVIVVDTRQRLIDINGAAFTILHIPPVAPAAQSITSLFNSHRELTKLLKSPVEGRREFEVVDANGNPEHYELQIIPLLDDRDILTSHVIIIHDVRERIRTQAELMRETTYVRLLQDVSTVANDASDTPEILLKSMALIARDKDWVAAHVMMPAGDPVRLQSNGQIHCDNRERWSRLIALLGNIEVSSGETIVGQAFADARPTWYGDSVLVRRRDLAVQGLEAGVNFAVAIPVIVRNDVHSVIQFFGAQHEQFSERFREVLSNIGLLIGRAIERKQIEEEIRTLAFCDALTGLQNRQAFQQVLEEAMAAAVEAEDQLAILFVDLDGFKKVNDSLGHAAGDAILREVATRYTRVVRESDSIGRPGASHSVSRLGGDEFTILLTHIRGPQDAGHVARRLLDELAIPIHIGDTEVFVGASIGIAVYPDHGTDCDRLLSHADDAMYHAKKLGTNQYQFYSGALRSAAAQRFRIESRLRGVLERKDFRLHFQPLRNAQSGELSGAEVLLRWSDSELGEVGPSEFIPIAEEMGLIIEIGEWVFRRTCEYRREWRERGLAMVIFGVNISSRQLRDPNLIDRFCTILEETGTSTGEIMLELTESSIVQDDEVTRSALHRLSDMGFGLALDDFGTGYSSLTHLRQFPISHLKIDRSFVKDMMTNPDDLALTQAIIAMAHNLRLSVIAEGVETEEQAIELRRSGCDELQGYLCGRPSSAEQFIQLLEREKGNPPS